MSSHSYVSTCPNCGKQMNCNTDNRPFEKNCGECLYCGFGYHTVSYQNSLEDLNELREQHNEDYEENIFKPLIKLPVFDDNLKY